MASPTITDLYLYPVKSCRGIRVAEADLWETGLYLDRFWMVVDGDGMFVSQRDLPRMALIETALRFDALQLKAPGMLRLDIPVQGFDYDPARRIQVHVWDDTVAAFAENDLVNRWFSDFLGRELRLVRIDPDHRRVCSRDWTGAGQPEAITQFADGFPVLLLSRASLEALNARLAAAGHAAVPMDRFRPNVVIDGVDAHDEDHAASIETDDWALRPVKPCARCRITCTDQQTAEVSGEPLDTLAAYRFDARVEGLAFGVNAVVARGADEATIKVGEPVRVVLDFKD
ncbi:MAG: MOSC domain-containing protein [Lautropia sp.]